MRRPVWKALAAAARPGRDDISTEFSYLDLSWSPTSRNDGIARQHVLTPHEPDTPWQRHFIFINDDKIYNDNNNDDNK